MNFDIQKWKTEYSKNTKEILKNETKIYWHGIIWDLLLLYKKERETSYAVFKI